MKKSNKLIDDLYKYLRDIEETLPQEKEFLKNKTLQYSISMLMLNIINACIDLANQIIISKSLGYPETYREAFTLLEKNKIIDENLSKKLKDLVGLRNLLAHEYGSINFELLHEHASEIKFIEGFIEKIIKFL